MITAGLTIRRDPLSQDAPAVFVDEEDIARTGLSSINDVLQRRGGRGFGGDRPALPRLRRTLMLVDGLRFVHAASASRVSGSVDLNAVPESMIERVEVLQDGASASHDVPGRYVYARATVRM